jgi:hypothetical protein
VLFKANYLRRHGEDEYILERTRRMAKSACRAPDGRSTGIRSDRQIPGGERRDITVSYAVVHGSADLNNYDQFYGNLRNPILRPNEHSLIPTDVPHRLLVRGTIGLPGRWIWLRLSRSGPVSVVCRRRVPGLRWGTEPRGAPAESSQPRSQPDAAVDLQEVPRSGGDQGLQHFWRIGRAGRQSNTASSRYGQFFNPIERSIGFVLDLRSEYSEVRRVN